MNKKSLIIIIYTIILFLVLYFFPINFQSNSISILLSITTFIFSIFAGFSIADRYKRLNKIRSNDGAERSTLTYLYESSIIFGNKFQKELRNVIEEYFINTLDYKIYDYHKTGKKLKKIEECILSLNPKSSKQISFYGFFIDHLQEIKRSRGSTITAIGEKLSFFEWFIFIFLSIIITFCLILINAPGLVYNIVITILGTCIFMILYFVFSLDRLSWKENERIFEPYQKAFESMGLLRYYNQNLLKSKRVKVPLNTSYRIAKFPYPYPDFRDKKVITINKNNNPLHLKKCLSLV